MYPLPRGYVLDEPAGAAHCRGKGSPEDVDLLDNVAKQIAGKCLCALGEFSVMAVTTGIKQFRADFDVESKEVNEMTG